MKPSASSASLPSWSPSPHVRRRRPIPGSRTPELEQQRGSSGSSGSSGGGGSGAAAAAAGEAAFLRRRRRPGGPAVERLPVQRRDRSRRRRFLGPGRRLQRLRSEHEPRRVRRPKNASTRTATALRTTNPRGATRTRSSPRPIRSTRRWPSTSAARRPRRRPASSAPGASSTRLRRARRLRQLRQREHRREWLVRGERELPARHGNLTKLGVNAPQNGARIC